MIRSIIDWLLPWQTVRETDVWLYQQHIRTGARRAVRLRHQIWSPVDFHWLHPEPGPSTAPPAPRKK